MKQALEALERGETKLRYEAITALRAAIEKAERPWQGLTNDEKRSLVEWAHPDIIDAIELRLRERNT